MLGAVVPISIHTGKWALSNNDLDDLIFSSDKPVIVVLTVTKEPPWEVQTISVNVNGSPITNGKMGAGEVSRTLRISAVSTISIVTADPTSPSCKGDYQLSTY